MFKIEFYINSNIPSYAFNENRVNENKDECERSTIRYEETSYRFNLCHRPKWKYGWLEDLVSLVDP